jgi:putative acetyltransferase
MGTGEGTMLAAEAASRASKEIKGLILYAVLATTLKDALQYMAGDGNSLALCNLFDTEKDGTITRQEFDADPKKIRERQMMGVGFEVFDPNKDGVLTVEDMPLLRKPILDGIASENLGIVDAFLKSTAVVSIPRGWVKDHFSHAPMWTFLAPLDMPVGFFHGSGDNLTPIAAVRQLAERAARAGKKNFRFHYFDGLDHSLGIVAYFVRGTLPEGHKAIFEFIRAVNQAAFGGCEEANLIDKLRGDQALLSLVAECESGIVGHILFSRIWIVTSPEWLPTVALAPVAVLPEHQRRGIGRRLIVLGLELLREQGERIVIVVGDPDYYRRFGFSSAKAESLKSPFPREVFMALELETGALELVCGAVIYPPAFDL